MARKLKSTRRVALHGLRLPICEAIAYALVRHEEWVREPVNWGEEPRNPSFGVIQIGSPNADRHRDWTVWVDGQEHMIKITRRSKLWEVEYRMLHGMHPTLVGALEIALQ